MTIQMQTADGRKYKMNIQWTNQKQEHLEFVQMLNEFDPFIFEYPAFEKYIKEEQSLKMLGAEWEVSF